jgi:hypothetical protein
MMSEEFKWRIGARVQKKDGYMFRGTIVSVFKTLERKVRYVVEAEDVYFCGTLIICSNDELEDIK